MILAMTGRAWTTVGSWPVSPVCERGACSAPALEHARTLINSVCRESADEERTTCDSPKQRRTWRRHALTVGDGRSGHVLRWGEMVTRLSTCSAGDRGPGVGHSVPGFSSTKWGRGGENSGGNTSSGARPHGGAVYLIKAGAEAAPAQPARSTTRRAKPNVEHSHEANRFGSFRFTEIRNPSHGNETQRNETRDLKAKRRTWVRNRFFRRQKRRR